MNKSIDKLNRSVYESNKSFSWLKLVETVSDECGELERITAAMRKLNLRDEISTNPNRTNSFCMGDIRLRQHMQTLDMFKMDIGGYVDRSDQQRLFHYWFTQALLPHFYGHHEWPLHAQRVLMSFTHDSVPQGLMKVRPEVLVVTPRRYGKTWSIAMFVASVLLNVPGIKVAVFSTGHRASNWLMMKVAKFINDIEGGGERICRQNQEQLFVSPVALSKGKSVNSSEAKARQQMEGTSEFYSFPGSVNSKLPLSLPFTLYRFLGGKQKNLRSTRNQSEKQK